MATATKEQETEFSIIGKRNPKIEAHQKASGETRYAGDIKLPRLIWAKLLRSPHPHARIRSIDASRALACPGVQSVITGADMPVTIGIMPTSQDEHPLAVDKVRYVGDPVAAVAAVDEETAADACRLIDVAYELLPPILTIDEALTREDVKIHEHSRRANVHREVHLDFGDVEGAFAEADHVQEDEFFFEGTTHAAMENYAAVAHWELNDKLTLWSSTQVPHYLHRELAKVFEVPKSRIRVIAPPVGGGFGGKSDPFSHEFAVALLSRRCGRPVKIVLDREEAFYTHRGRHPVRMHVKTGVKNDGTITAVHFQSILDGGGYSSYGLASTYYTGALLGVTYRIPAYKFDGTRVYTNKPACGPKRGHGTTQPRFAFECHLDKIAEQLGLNPVEYRKKILTPPYSETVNQLRVTSSAANECLDRVVEASDFGEKFRKLPYGKGVGVALSCYISGAGLPIYWNDMPHSGATIKVDRGGGVTVYCGVADLGQGCDSLLAYIAAEELGVEPGDVRVVAGDTDLAPVDLGSYSSRVTFMAGNAVLDAAQKMKRQIFAAVAENLEVPLERLAASWGQVYDTDDRTRCVTFEEAAILAESACGTLATVGSYKPPHLAGNYKGSGVGPSPAYSFTSCVAQVEVNTDTGHVRVEKLWLAHDCGRALNPVNVEGQIEGSAYMGLGEALLEESAFRQGLHKKPSFLEYRLPTFLDMPPVESIIVENPDREGPYGAKEAGEGPLNPVPPAIANAIFDAIGVRLDATPFTPEKVLRALARVPGGRGQGTGSAGIAGRTEQSDPRGLSRRRSSATESRPTATANGAGS
ncbi:MAG: molybdopterin-dependent oxidoreductase [Chloroflexi bacterium]|nr:molybdopterin-dependent oxidoreductase [Chloroflexota bacterium]